MTSTNVERVSSYVLAFFAGTVLMSLFVSDKAHNVVALRGVAAEQFPCSTIARILKDHSIKPAPNRPTSWQVDFVELENLAAAYGKSLE